jgi:hypothetical protein
VIESAYHPDRDIVASASAPRASRNLTTRDGAEQLAVELDQYAAATMTRILLRIADPSAAALRPSRPRLMPTAEPRKHPRHVG